METNRISSRPTLTVQDMTVDEAMKPALPSVDTLRCGLRPSPGAATDVANKEKREVLQPWGGSLATYLFFLSYTKAVIQTGGGVIPMPISPLGAGDGRPQTWTFTTDTSVFLLSGVQNSNIAQHLEDVNTNNALYICTGTWNITNVGSLGPPIVYATAIFTPSAADLLNTNPLGKPGLYKIYPVVTLSSGPVPMDAQTIAVVSLP